MQILKADHDQRVENYKLQDGAAFNAGRSPHNARVLQPKVLRGGGGASRSFYNFESSTSSMNINHGSGDSSLDCLDVPPVAVASVVQSDLPQAPITASAYNGPPPPYQTIQQQAGAKPSVLSRFLGQK